MREAAIQDAFCAYLRKRDVPFVQARRDKKSTIQVGWPDFTVFLPSHVLLIEMKTDKGVVSPEQKQCHEHLARNGYRVWLCTSVDQCVRLCEAEAVEAVPTIASPAPQNLFILGPYVWNETPQGAHRLRIATAEDRRNLPIKQ